MKWNLNWRASVGEPSQKNYNFLKDISAKKRGGSEQNPCTLIKCNIFRGRLKRTCLLSIKLFFWRPPQKSHSLFDGSIIVSSCMNHKYIGNRDSFLIRSVGPFGLVVKGERKKKLDFLADISAKILRPPPSAS